VSPKKEEPFLLYTSAMEFVLGTMLTQKNENNKEKAIYYLSRTLVGYEIKYVYMKKLSLVVVFAKNKLRHYMLNHTTYVITKPDSLKYMMNKIY